MFTTGKNNKEFNVFKRISYSLLLKNDNYTKKDKYIYIFHETLLKIYRTDFTKSLKMLSIGTY